MKHEADGVVGGGETERLGFGVGVLWDGSEAEGGEEGEGGGGGGGVEVDVEGGDDGWLGVHFGGWMDEWC